MSNFNNKSQRKKSNYLKKTHKKLGKEGGFLSFFSKKKHSISSLNKILLEEFSKKKLNYDYIQKLLDTGANINIKNDKGQTLAHICVERNDLPLFNILEKYNPRYDLVDTEGRTPFFTACFYGYLEMTKLLWKRGADVNMANNFQKTPFHIACYNGHFQIIYFLSKLKVEKNILHENENNSLGNTKSAINRLDYQYGTYSIDFNKKDLNGSTAAHSTAERGFDDIMLILSNIFDINGNPQVKLNIQNNKGETPCFCACKYGQSKIIKVFINLNNINHQKRIEFNKENYAGETPCYIAAERGHKNVISELSLLNIDVNIPESQYGQTPSFAACKRGHKRVLEELIKNGADLYLATPKETGGFTPLFIAIYNNNLEIAKVLLVNGYTPRIKDFSNKNKILIETLLDWAQEHENLKETFQQLTKISDFYKS